MTRWRTRLLAYGAMALLLGGASWYVLWDAKRTKEPQVIFAPTPEAAVTKMLEMAEVTPSDVVYDLGCGDGRIVIAAAKKYGCKAVGVELRPEVVQQARQNVQAAGMSHLVEIREGDIFTADFRDATVVALYLLPNLNVRLIPQLNALKPGTRVVSYMFDMPGVPPLEKAQWKADQKELTVYLWKTPIPMPPGD
jgi:SAM-dependent methyltransferase